MAETRKIEALSPRLRRWCPIVVLAIAGWVAVDALISIGIQRSPSDVAVIVARELVTFRAAATSGVSGPSPSDALAGATVRLAQRLQLPIGRLSVLHEPSTAGRPIVVSLTAFPDQPRPAAWNLWLASPKHLACFEDGRVEFWTNSRFQKLDLGAYTDAEQWLADARSR